MARGGNPWFTGGVDNTLSQYVPLPFQEIVAAGQAVQGRYDQSMASIGDTETGLASIETSLPGHRDHVNKLSSGFRNETEALLKQYNNKADDPQFQRELRRLTNRYAKDPSLTTIMQANEQSKMNRAIEADLLKKGELFIKDQGTGIDERGNIVNDVGNIRGVDTINVWDQMMAGAASKKINDGRGWISNEQNLNQVKSQIKDAITNGDPMVDDLIGAYTQRGMNLDQAKAQVLNDFNRLSGKHVVDKQRDYNYDNTNFQREKFEYQKRLDLGKAQQGDGSAMNFPMISVEDADIKNIPDLKRIVNKEIKSLRDSIDPVTGKISEPKNNPKFYPDSEENQRMLERSGGYDVEYAGGLLGQGAKKYLIPKNTEQTFNDKFNTQIDYMRNELGISSSETPSNVLNQYEKFINESSFIPKRIKPTVEGTSRAIYEAEGVSFDNAVIVDKKGNYKKVTNADIDMSKAKDDGRYMGLVTYEIPGLEGNKAVAEYTRTIDGVLTTYYKKAPDNLIADIPITLMSSSAQSSGLDNGELRNPDNGFVKILADENGNPKVAIAPQVLPGGVRLVNINPKTGEVIKNADGSFNYMDNKFLRDAEKEELNNSSIRQKAIYRSTTRETNGR